jgi:Fe-S-cluster-containing dehydrogenase component
VLKGLGATLGVAAYAKALAPLTELTKEFGYALNLSICIGCRKCAEACHVENNHDRPSHQSYIRVLEMTKGSMDFERGNVDYDHPCPQPDKFYMPVQCQQCEQRALRRVCPSRPPGRSPTASSWSTTTGASAAATARPRARITRAASTGTKPEIPRRRSTRTSRTSNRIRPQGVMEKCTFCLHRTREGRLPACLEACPTGARVFGNSTTPTPRSAGCSKTSACSSSRRSSGPKPRFFYFFDE